MNTFIFVTLILSCAIVASAKPRIIGGLPTKPHEFPYMISLQWLDNPDQKHFCGGAILNENWIITAGHCVKAFSKVEGMTDIVAGAYLISHSNHNEQRRKPKQIIVHESYTIEQSPAPHDIALIEVDVPFELNKNVGSIQLPADEPRYPTGNLTLTGWGATSTGDDPKYSDKLLKADLEVVTLEMCYKMYSTWNSPLDDTNLCAGDRNRAPCNCDSGGPLVEFDTKGQAVLLGTVSWSYQPCATPGKTAVFVNITHYVKWIQDIINKK
uniref:Putative trypsin-like serine protease n=1 Tax=Nyssomyia neivai TaxID=330878 RepID=A0A1L8DQM8_9DIPT